MSSFYASFFCLITLKAVHVQGQTFKGSLDLNDLPDILCGRLDQTTSSLHIAMLLKLYVCESPKSTKSTTGV